MCTFFFGLASFISIIILGFIHVVVCVKNLFFFTAELYSIVGIYHSLFIHFLVEGQLALA